MKTSDYLRAISVLLDSTIKDVEEWEKKGKKRWVGYGDTEVRKGATRAGIKNSIAMLRRMLLQVAEEVDE